MPNYVGFFSRCSGRKIRSRHTNDADIVFFHAAPHLQIIRRHHHLHSGIGAPHLALQVLVNSDTDEESDGERQRANHH